MWAAPAAGEVAVYNGATRQLQPTNALTVASITNVAVKGNATMHSITATNLTASVPVETDAAKKLVSGTVTGTGAFVKDQSPTIVTPTIASLANANHSHQDSAGGGVLAAPGITSFANATHTHANAAGGGVLTPSAVGLSDPNADRILFWDDSAGVFAWLTAGSGLTITTTTMTSSGGGSGDFVGPASSTDNAIVRFDGTTGKLGQNSGVTIDGSDNINIPGTASIGSAAGVSITGANGIVTFLGLGDGADEDFKFDLNGTANTAVITSTTGMAKWDFGTSWVFGLGSLELGHATANTVTASGGDMTIEGNRLFRVGGADVPVADGGTGLSSGTSGGILYYSASGTLASSAALAANAIVVGGGAGATPATVTTGAGNLTALALAANATGGFVTTDGTATLSAKTISGPLTLAEGASVTLDAAGSADGAWSGIARAGTAGAALAFGDLIVLDATDSRWELADANSAAGADGDSRGMIGICVLAAAGDGSATTILLQGIVRADAAFPALTINNPVYISETAGDITGTLPTTEDNVVRIVGTATTADEIYFNPREFIIYDAP